MIIMISVGSDSIHMRSMGSLSLIGEEAEIFKYVVLRMASNPGTIKPYGQTNFGAERGARAMYRISVYIDRIMRSSACLTATSRPLASHSHAMLAGAWHIAQSGSILMTALPGYEYFLENILAEVSGELDYTKVEWQPWCDRRAGKQYSSTVNS